MSERTFSDMYAVILHIMCSIIQDKIAYVFRQINVLFI